jgi:hypothetical protein
MTDHTLTKKRSLGKLRVVAHRTKERSPNMTDIAPTTTYRNRYTEGARKYRW